MVGPIFDCLPTSSEGFTSISEEIHLIAAQQALELLLPLMALFPLLAEIQRLRPLAKCYGLEINVRVRCKM